MPLPGLLENVPLAPLTTIGIGGPARFFLHAASVDVVRDAIDWAEDAHHPLFVLGGGSNVLVSDQGFPGLVLRIDLRGIGLESEGDRVVVKVAAGEPWDAFVQYATERQYAGIECLSGIPGSTGATPIQNVGAYGQEVAETIVRVEVLDRSSGKVVWLTNEECDFAYRSSRFKYRERDRFIVLSVTFELNRGGTATIRYPELQKAVEARGVPAGDLPGVRNAVLAIRRRKGMVIDLADPDTRSDGSFFMNPVVSAAAFAELTRHAPDAPHFPASEGVKLSAAWLIEQAGFHKGFVHGNVGLSTKHTLAIINRGGGTAREVLELVRMIRARVRDSFGVELQPEPVFVGIEN